MCATGLIHEQEVLRQSLHELMIAPLLGSAVPSQVSITESMAEPTSSCHPERILSFEQSSLVFLGGLWEQKGYCLMSHLPSVMTVRVVVPLV